MTSLSNNDLLDTAPCGFLSFTDEGTITEVNTTLLDLIGYARNDLVGRSVEAILTIGSRIFYQTHLFPLVKLHGAASEIFLILRTREGGNVSVLTNVKRRECGGVALNDCVFMHISERRKYEEALLRAKQEADAAHLETQEQHSKLADANTLLELQHKKLEEQATELEAVADKLRNANEKLIEHGETLKHERARADNANQAKSIFLANMSHELRTPLNAIGGYTQLLELGIHGAMSEEQLDVLGRIQHSQRHLLGLINDVLNLARIEAGHVEYLIEAVSLRDVIYSVMPMIEPQIGAKELTYSVDVPLGASVYADREKLAQIILNLLSNATKFTPSKGHVFIDVQPQEGVTDSLLLNVNDTGVGIPADRLANIFEPFVQIDGQGRPDEGTGLGLAISRDLARGMGGDIQARSTEGSGSVFTIVLPVDALSGSKVTV